MNLNSKKWITFSHFGNKLFSTFYQPLVLFFLTKWMQMVECPFCKETWRNLEWWKNIPHHTHTLMFWRKRNSFTTVCYSPLSIMDMSFLLSGEIEDWEKCFAKPVRGDGPSLPRKAFGSKNIPTESLHRQKCMTTHELWQLILSEHT